MSATGVAAAPQGRSRRFWVYLTYIPLLVLLLLWLWLLAESLFVFRQIQFGLLGSDGPDFAMFYSAVHVLRDGGNPYDPALLYRMDTAVMHAAHLPAFRFAPLVRVGNPPILFWALQPLAALPYRLALDGWLLFTAVCLVVGFLSALRYLGWSRQTVILLFFLAPQVQIGLQSANLVQIIFAAIGLSLALMRRSPLLAGALLSAVWLKPQVGLPIAALVMLFHVDALRRALGGFLLGSAVGLAFSLLTTGLTVFRWWLHSFTGYTSTIAIQGDLASLSGIYYRWASPGLRFSLEAATLAIALGLTAWWWWRTRHRRPLPPVSVAWLWFVWFLATPYAHFYDQVLLTTPVLALLGRNGSRLCSPLCAVTLYALFLCIVPYDASIPQMQLIWLPTLGAAICSALAASRFRERDEVAQVATGEVTARDTLEIEGLPA